jgi:hypothetical protein
MPFFGSQKASTPTEDSTERPLMVGERPVVTRRFPVTQRDRGEESSPEPQIARRLPPAIQGVDRREESSPEPRMAHRLRLVIPWLDRLEEGSPEPQMTRRLPPAIQGVDRREESSSEPRMAHRMPPAIQSDLSERVEAHRGPIVSDHRPSVD